MILISISKNLEFGSGLVSIWLSIPFPRQEKRYFLASTNLRFFTLVFLFSLLSGTHLQALWPLKSGNDTLFEAAQNGGLIILSSFLPKSQDYSFLSSAGIGVKMRTWIKGWVNDKRLSGYEFTLFMFWRQVLADAIGPCERWSCAIAGFVQITWWAEKFTNFFLR